MGDSIPESHGFQTTLWTVVRKAGDSRSPDAAEALERLCQIYWPPLYSYAYARLKDSHEAEDVTQAFFAQLLERQDLGGLHPERGRFRAFLLAAMKNFLGKHWARKQARKRGGGALVFSFDQISDGMRQTLEEVDDQSPDRLFDAQWARTLVQDVYRRLEDEFARDGLADRYEVLSRFLLGEVGPGDHAAGARELGVTESGFRSAVMRTRQRFRELFREAVLQTVSEPDEVDEEMRHLLTSIS